MFIDPQLGIGAFHHPAGIFLQKAIASLIFDAFTRRIIPHGQHQSGGICRNYDKCLFASCRHAVLGWHFLILLRRAHE